MFGSPFPRTFDGDAFFSDFHAQHRRMMMGPFFGPSPSPFLPITDGGMNPHYGSQVQEHSHRRHVPQIHNDLFAMSPFGGFGMMDNMFRSMEGNFERMANDPNSQTYSHSSVMSFSNAGNGAPQYYEATSSSKTAPGGVKEDRKTVRDSQTGTQKMSISHRIGDREHKIEKSKDHRSGNITENQDFVNLDEADAGKFDREFQQKTRHHRHRGSGPYPDSNRRRQLDAITAGPSYRDREEDDLPRPHAPPHRGRRPKRTDLHDV